MIYNRRIQIVDQNNKFSDIHYGKAPVSDVEIDKFLKKEFLGKESAFKTLIIPCSLGQSHTYYLGLRIALHIRLTKELGENRFVPIIFLSFDSYKIINKFNPFAPLIYAPGSYFYNYTDNWKDTITNLKPASEKEFFSYINERIIIPKPDKMGNHSLANEWGAYVLGFASRVLGENEFPNNNAEFYSSLFIKNILRDTNLSKDSFIDLPIEVENKEPYKFLFIDDEAEKGWSYVLDKIAKKIYPNSSFDICKSKGEADKIDFKDYDLIFLDLRLSSSEDKDSSVKDIKETTGAEILGTIKSKAPYVSVIIFTASNKAWNLKQLLDLGADDYYVKESPLNHFSPSFTKENTQNLLKSIKMLINKSSELKPYWATSSNIKKQLSTYINNEIIGERIREKLTIAFGLLRKPETQYDTRFLFTNYELAFLTYFSIFNEIAANRFNIKKQDPKNGEHPIYTYQERESKRFLYNKDKKTQLVKGEHLYTSLSEKYEQELKDSPDHPKAQMSMLILLKKNKEKQTYSKLMSDVNYFRNKSDFIHSDKESMKDTIENNRKKWKDVIMEKCSDVLDIIHFLITTQ